MRALLLAALVASLGTISAAAQQETVAQHFAAYRAALDHGDLTSAEREAAAALHLSESRDGDGGHTAVLALNLATTRLSLGHGADALSPAQEALTLAQANPNSGVDPRLAALVEAHAALNTQQPAMAAALNAALQAMHADDPWQADIFSAADDLARWEFAQHQYRDAAATWATAVSASAAGADPVHARAAMQINLASALIMVGANEGFDVATGTRARTALVEAIVALRPDLRQLGPSEPVPAGQRQYGLAMAWFRVLDSLIDKQGVRVPHAPAFPTFDQPRTSDRPLCRMTFHAVPLPTYPPHQNNVVGVGGVSLYWQTDEAGTFRRIEVISSVGADFADAVRAVYGRWNMTKVADGSSADCTMETYGIVTVNFDIPSSSRNDTLINSRTHFPDHTTGDH